MSTIKPITPIVTPVVTGAFDTDPSTIHVLDAATCGGEFTYCGWAFDSDDVEDHGAWVAHKHPQQVTCVGCRVALQRAQRVIRTGLIAGVRFR